jgi:hypothetical protein
VRQRDEGVVDDERRLAMYIDTSVFSQTSAGLHCPLAFTNLNAVTPLSRPDTITVWPYSTGVMQFCV